MKKEQVLKLLKVAIITTAIMLLCEIIFSFDAVNNWFSDLITNSKGWEVYVIIWLIMFLQVTILNIPAYIVLSASISVGIKALSWEFILTVLSAYMAGAILAYWLGRWFGKKAVKWCAGSEEDYNKWSSMLNTKGKWWYFLTVLFPCFPDDLLCIVAGAVKFKFWFYFFANLIGRGIGLITMILALNLVHTGNNIPWLAILWGIALIGEIMAFIVVKKKNFAYNKKERENNGKRNNQECERNGESIDE